MTVPFVRELAAIVAQYGERAAIEDRGVTCSYRELWQRAEIFAASLQEPNVVPLSAAKSLDYYAQILGCWMAGAAFTPLPSDWPERRRRAVVARIADAAHDPRRAYVLFTSGSTGEPKGVCVGHAGLVPMLRDQIQAFGLAPGKRSLALLSTSFDASISDFGTTLLSGATLVLDPLRGHDLVDHLTQLRITHVDLPPAMLSLPNLAADRWPAAVETIILGGESCAPALVRALAARKRVVYVYGPTEATICTSLVTCGRDWDRPRLGTCIAEMRHRVVDGELWIAGAGLALEYLDDPELTRAKFVHRDGVRWYRSGDRAHVDDRGELIFEGRLDRQCKIHGKLIAPEEVERCLATIDAVERVWVEPTEAEGGKLQLTAFVAPASLSVERLREGAAADLPAWMIPARFVCLERLPETSSGKVDRRALLALTQSPARSHAAPTTSLTSVEARLAECWRQVLGTSPYDGADFFAEGGDSFALLELLAHAEAQGIGLDSEALWQRPTWTALLHASGRSATSVPTTSLEAEVDAALATLPQPAIEPRPADGGDVLITGATGFLGGHLLPRLLDALPRSATIFCLSRRPRPHPDPRVRYLRGDLRDERFGLPAEQWRELSERAFAVFHLAAEVSFVHPFSALRALNVLGTARVIAFCRQGRAKRLHYASTLSVGACQSPKPAVFYERPLAPAATTTILGGYAQSKWVAERLLSRASPHAQILRFGLLTADTLQARPAADCQLWHCLQGLRQLGCLPHSTGNVRFDATPVDHAAAAMVGLSRRGPAGLYHVCNRQSVDLEALLEGFRLAGLDLPRVSAAEFRARAQRLPQTRSVATAMISLAHRMLGDATHQERDLFLASQIRFDTREADRFVARCPHVGPREIARMLRAEVNA